LLGIGLPLTIGAGAVAAAGLFSGDGLWLAALLGAIVAPTDAALGAQIMADERVPARVRRVLNVESGLNDGIVTPFVNLFLAGALASESMHTSGISGAALDLLGGAGLGIAIGVGAAVLLRLASRAGWSDRSFRPLAAGGVAILTYCVALEAGTNGFVAAFICGMAFGTVMRADTDVLDFTEEGGTLLSLVVWFLFGAVMLVPGMRAVDWRAVAFAIIVLTIARMGPVALALAGAGFARSTVAFIGWFGPRGLASVVFGLIAIDALEPHDAQVVLGTVTLTVLISVVAHGVSGAPLASIYQGRIQRLPPGAPELGAVAPIPRRKPRQRLVAREVRVPGD
jgi:NhaP-type Na+/H+ or K+/H+ antiporter